MSNVTNVLLPDVDLDELNEQIGSLRLVSATVDGESDLRKSLYALESQLTDALNEARKPL